MKLKLFSDDPLALKNTLSLIVPARKSVVLRFTPEILYVILINEGSVSQEPQIWCKVKMRLLFDQIQIQSNQDNIVLLELNGELLLQTLRHFEKSSTDGLNIRLQKRDASESNENSRTVSLTLYYTNITASTGNVNHTFKIPANILRSTHPVMQLQEPTLSSIDLVMRLPNEFATIYKRLDKFKKTYQNDTVSIKSSRRNGGFLGFLMEEDGKYKVTISWNEGLDIRKPNNNDPDSYINSSLFVTRDDDYIDEDDDLEDKEVSVRLRDWKMASKIVATCKTVILSLADREGVVLTCLLEESEDVEIIYYINALRIRADN